MTLLELWTNFLPIANVIFAIVFVVVIYSTAVGQGLSNYSVKKILPRLIIVAVGVNISFYLCAFIVDVINIVAVGIPNLIFANALNMSSNTNSFISELQGVLGGILGVVLIFCFVGIALVAMIVTVVALAARQIILSALVVISPIAIVCAVLPATQKWFDKWLKTFVQLLAVYPMFMLVWAATRWFQEYGAETLVANTILRFIIQTVCTIIPAVAIYPLLKSSGGVMGQITGAINKSPLGMQGTAGKIAKDHDNLRQLGYKAGINRLGQRMGGGIADAINRNEVGADEAEIGVSAEYQQKIAERDRLDAELQSRANDEKRLRDSGLKGQDLIRAMRRRDESHFRASGLSGKELDDAMGNRHLYYSDMTNQRGALNRDIAGYESSLKAQNKGIQARNADREVERELNRTRYGGNKLGLFTGQRFNQRKAVVEGAIADEERKAAAQQIQAWETTGRLKDLTGSDEQAAKAAARAVSAINKDMAELITGQMAIIQNEIDQAAKSGREMNSLEVIKDFYKKNDSIYARQAAAKLMSTQGNPGGEELVNMWDKAVEAANAPGATDKDRELMVGLRSQVLSDPGLASFMTGKDAAAVEAMKQFKAADKAFYADSGNLKGMKIEDLRNMTKDAIERMRAGTDPTYFAKNILGEIQKDFALNPGAYKPDSRANWKL